MKTARVRGKAAPCKGEGRVDVLNAQEAYTYLDGLMDDRERSAALAIHLSYMDYCSSLAEAGRKAAETPLDMLLLYRAAVAAFLDLPIGEAREPLPAES